MDWSIGGLCVSGVLKKIIKKWGVVKYIGLEDPVVGSFNHSDEPLGGTVCRT
jgi:hypothetical protein